MGNNPVIGIDPNGEFVFAVPVFLAAIKAGAIIGASVGAASYGLNWAITGEGNAGGLLKSTALGALGGAVAGGVGNAISQLGVAAIGKATGLGAGLANLGFQAKLSVERIVFSLDNETDSYFTRTNDRWMCY